MQSPNHKPGNLDTLSWHAIETNHRSGNSDKLSQDTQHRQAIPACMAKYDLYKRGCKCPKQKTSWHSKIAVEPEETCTRRAREQAATTLWRNTVKKETSKANTDHNLIFKNTAAWVIMILTKATLGYNTRIDAAPWRAAHNNHIPPIKVAVIDLAITHHIDHIADHPHIEILQLFNPEITIGHTHDHPTDLQAGLP